MTRAEYTKIETHMLTLMKDSAHDPMHIFRVLCNALRIAEREPDADMDVVIAASLLHDIGREAQSKNLELDHAQIGANMALEFLPTLGWNDMKAAHTCDCIRTHRFRRGDEPKSIEAKIVFDADKLDAVGAIGVARTLNYGGQYNEPLYALDGSGEILTAGGGAEISTFFQEFNYKLIRLYDKFYTKRGAEIAESHRAAATDFYRSLESEIMNAHKSGNSILEATLRT